MIRVLITGSTAFVGSHLADRLVAAGYEVHGLKRPRSPEIFMRSDVHYHVGDITDYTAMYHLINEVRPHFIYHLAAQSFVPLSWEAPTMTQTANLNGSLNILEAVRQVDPSGIRVLMAGTSEEYGEVRPEECPITEDQPLRPLSPYGASKVAMDMIARVYTKSYGLKVTVSRAFNHTGPRRGEEFLTSKIAKKLAEVKLHLSEPVIELGNMDAVRDFTDVRDTVSAYMLLALDGIPGEVYNIGTGKGRSIQEVFDTLTIVSGIRIRIEQNPKFMRPSDVPLLICDASKIRTQLGWEPTIEFETTMMDLFNYWVERLEK